MATGRGRSDDRTGGWRRAVRGARLAVAGCALALGGCYEYGATTVAVRDRDTLRPVLGAQVTVSNTTLNPAGPEKARGVTDAEGMVALRVAVYNRLLVRVEADGYAPIVATGDHPGVVGDTGWFGPTTDEEGGRAKLEVRLLP